MTPFVLILRRFGRWASATVGTVGSFLALSSPAGAQTPATSPAEHVLFDIDLTKGRPRAKAPAVRIQGGRFQGGWRVVDERDNRIVLDAGYKIKDGYLEADITVDRPPYCPESKCPESVKVNFVGLHENAGLNQETHDDDIFYLRTGSWHFKFFNVKALGRRFDTSECETRVGDIADWVPDDKTVHKFRLEWKGGVIYVHDYKGRTTVCDKDRGSRFPRPPKGNPHGVDRPMEVDELRYAFLGADHFTNLSPVGMRFLRVKMVDYHRPPGKFPIYVSPRSASARK